jgi:hypothetical protein
MLRGCLLTPVGRTFAGLIAGLVLYLGQGTPPVLAQTVEINGSCVGFDLSQDVRSPQNPFGEGRLATALYDGVQTFTTQEGDTAAGTLQLGDVVQIIEDGDLVGVRSIGADDASVQYVQRGDLGCENKPLISDITHLERKAVIKVETALSSSTEGRSVSAYRTPFLNDCADNCRKLSRFDLYFVFAETADALLLSRDVRAITSGNSPMVGWIAKSDVYEWPYSVGLRVREDFTYGDGYGTVCGFFTLEEARENAPDKCQPILGGPSWFETSTRLLVMQQHPLDPDDTDPSPDEVIFETVAPISSRASDTVEVENGTVTAVDPAALRGADVDTLLRNNRIDLFFLIDGTRSMQPYLDSIRGTAGTPGMIQSILSSFENQLDAVRFRAGFRVFRDTNGADRNSIGEGLPLPEQDCSAMSAEDSRRNLQDFNTAIAQVQTSSETGDDYSEDLYGGLQQALRDLRGCPENRKLVFIITDAGYDEQEQVSRGVTPPSVSTMTTRFNEEFEGSAIFFLRPARNEALTSGDYNAAYDDVLTEANTILNGLNIVQEATAAGEGTADFLLQLGSSDDAAEIVSRINDTIVEANVQPEVINQLIIDIRGGASLQQAIQRLRAEEQDIPGYFWRLVEQSACDDLGEACTEATFQSVRQIFVRNDPNTIALDVWMDDEQLQAWDQLLDRATDLDTNVGEMRIAAVSAIDDAVRTVIREPPYEDENETFGEYLARAGYLPIGFKTPLLGYSMTDLIRQDRVSSCELNGLTTWLAASREMLRIVRNGDVLPDYTTSEDGLVCGTPVTPAGQLIHNPTSTIGERSLGAGTLRSSSTENTIAKPIYWVPQAYLP